MRILLVDAGDVHKAQGRPVTVEVQEHGGKQEWEEDTKAENPTSKRAKSCEAHQVGFIDEGHRQYASH